MGRKAKNIPQKKKQRENLDTALTFVRKANSLKDPLEQFAVFKKFTRNGLNIVFECRKYGEIDTKTFEWIFHLEKNNMKDVYNSCDWGWNEKKKKDEMTDDSAWYLVARTDDSVPVAFSHFRFDMDYGDPVLYCYEIQLEPSVRRCGLGKFMMQILELVAFSNQMQKVVLTALKNNTNSLMFFKSLNYAVDETSPEDTIFEQHSYVIMSKINKRYLK